MIAVMFEASGIVRDALIARGYEAVSVDVRATERPGPHIRGDVFDHLEDGWSGAIMHPPCTFLARSGLHWNRRRPERSVATAVALQDVRMLMDSPIPVWAIENPPGCIGSAIRVADQVIQPYQFGHDASKMTCLWLKGLPLLMPTGRFNGRYVRDPRNGKPVERWSNQTDAGQNRLPSTPDRWAIRSETYSGIANAIADQWGDALAGQTTELSLAI